MIESDERIPEPPPGQGRAYVETRGLRRTFGTVEALGAVDLQIAPGEFVALLGPSGCGKTTLLRCIAGLVSPSDGTILIEGRDMTRVPAHRRDLGMVFQSYALFPHMTVAENIRFGLKMHGVRGAEAEARVAEALGLVRMRGFEARYPLQLSGGQQQRVALARALVTRPKALLLDEPFGALDAKLRESMQIELRRVQRTLGVTTIFVTHDQQEALSMADRVAVMRAGRIEQFEAPERIYNRPATPFVADFIGQANRFKGRLVARGGCRAMVAVDGSAEPIPAQDDARYAVGDAVVMMVRPERIRIGAATPSAAEIATRGEIADLVFTGDRLNLHVQTPWGSIVAALANAGEGAATLAVGQTVSLAWPTDALLLFRDAGLENEAEHMD
jgi:spermidine/putrescine ABC transporter ATP-binding subunit